MESQPSITVSTRYARLLGNLLAYEWVLAGVFYVIAGGYGFYTLYHFPRWIQDDAYITFRYSSNLVHHGELNWNPGEDPVEGYTGVVWPVVIAGAMRVGVNPVLASHIIESAVYGLTGVLLVVLVWRWFGHGLASGSVALFYFTNASLFLHALSGLETMLFAGMVAVCLWLLLIALHTLKRPVIWEALLWLALLITSLVRPEGVVLAGLCGIGLLSARRQPLPRQTTLLRFGLIYLLPGAIYFIWRWNYYGQFFPNTYYAKLQSGFNRYEFDHFLSFMRDDLSFPLLMAFCLFAANVDVIWKQMVQGERFKLNPRSFLALVLISVAFMGILTVQYVRTLLITNYYSRFFVPFLPVGLLLMGLLFGLGLAALKSLHTEKPIQFVILLLFSLSGTGLHTLRQVDERSSVNYYAKYNQVWLASEHIQVAKLLKQKIPAGEWLVIAQDAGAIGYYSELPAIDLGLLNEEKLARKAWSAGQVSDYIYSFNPGVFVISSYQWDQLEITQLVDRQLEAFVEDARFDTYVLVKKYRNPYGSPYFQFVYARSDLAPAFAPLP